MPSQAEQAALTAAYVAEQRLLAASLSRDLVLLVRQIFSVADPGQSWPTTKLALDTLIRERRRQSANLAARYYVDLRQLAVPQSPLRREAAIYEARRRQFRPEVRVDPGTGLVHTRLASAAEVSEATRTIEAPLPEQPRPEGAPAELDGFADISEEDAWAELEKIAPITLEDIEELDEDRVDANLNATGVASYKKAIRAGQPPERARDTMAVNLAGSAATLALEGGRETIRSAVLGDDEAIGWARVTDADPCAFCAMLASRGAVYRSRQTAGGAKNKQFEGEGMFKFHNHDGCSAVPVFDADDPVLEEAERLYDKWLEVTRAAPGEKMIDAWTKYWDNREDKPRPETATG
ncbi:hypothetical protein [Actinomadura rubrisoli]|uniref:Capsid maturation protease n=1 Tax=Actinomadura rubrisoli TaxID=2530368 RepID=A0A4R5CDN4_9ACTN|nr:hypothetical protein [Actinomadura rubrisoli]TDD97635.1 hypothetical protein E1298_00970 [Actinomadura rubrisoli]